MDARPGLAPGRRDLQSCGSTALPFARLKLGGPTGIAPVPRRSQGRVRTITPWSPLGGVEENELKKKWAATVLPRAPRIKSPLHHCQCLRPEGESGGDQWKCSTIREVADASGFQPAAARWSALVPWETGSPGRVCTVSLPGQSRALCWLSYRAVVLSSRNGSSGRFRPGMGRFTRAVHC